MNFCVKDVMTLQEYNMGEFNLNIFNWAVFVPITIKINKFKKFFLSDLSF